MQPKSLMLVDGSSYLYRAFHALPPLTTAAGQPTGAIVGVLNMLHKLQREHRYDLFAVVMDAKGKTFRDELFAEYKANRPPMPDELQAQIEPLLEAIDAMGLPLLQVAGVEADDVIGTLATQASDAGIQTVISTGDKDMAQLVTERITLMDTMKDRSMDASGVEEKFGVTPAQMVDYLALVGDSSDNIPGVPKVGPKTAAKWLQQYGSVDNIKANAGAIKGKVGESLRASFDQLELSRKLATIDCSVALDIEPDELVAGEPDTARLTALYRDLELRSLLKGLAKDEENAPGSAAAQTPAHPARDYTTILTRQQLDGWLERLNAAELVALDTETTSIRYMEAELVGLSFSVTPGEAAYLPVAHTDPTPQLAREAVLDALKPWLENASRAKVGHHLKYDAHILRNYGIDLAGMRYDTMLESYVLNSTASRHDLDSVARKYLGIETVHYEDVAGKGAKQIRFDEVPLEQAAPYAAEDADVCLSLHQALWPQIQAVEALEKLYTDIEQPLVSVLEKIEYRGVLVDRQLLGRLSVEFAKKMAELERQAHDEAGSPFNLSSPKQLQAILFERLELPVIRKTPKGQPSTAEDVLQELAVDYALPQLILDYRSLSKLKSTYTDKLPTQINEKTGRIHTSYHQAVAATGRLSSSDPNLQNIPIRNEMGRRIRQAFIADRGNLLLAADYSQIELRIMAHLSGDDGLLRAFAENQDIHRATAAEVFDVPVDDITQDQRRSAKAINFGLIYGMSAFGLARQLKVRQGEAQAYIEQYFERYPGVAHYMEHTREMAREQGFVETVFGRRLYLPEITARQAQRRQYAERAAINAPMQGTAADIIKRAMIDVDAWLTKSGIAANIIMQVHDELVLEVREDCLATVREQVEILMTNAADLKVPLKVDLGAGANWDEAH